MQRGHFTTGDIGRLLGCSPAHVQKLIDEGHLGGFRLASSSHRRVFRADLESYLATLDARVRANAYEILARMDQLNGED